MGHTRSTTNRFPPLFLVACTLMAVGTAGLCTLFFLPIREENAPGLVYICLAFLLFGVGEIINHPKEIVSTPVPEKPNKPGSQLKTQFQRRRNPCSLGNLFGIAALLLFFIGLSALLFSN